MAHSTPLLAFTSGTIYIISPHLTSSSDLSTEPQTHILHNIPDNSTWIPRIIDAPAHTPLCLACSLNNISHDPLSFSTLTLGVFVDSSFPEYPVHRQPASSQVQVQSQPILVHLNCTSPITSQWDDGSSLFPSHNQCSYKTHTSWRNTQSNQVTSSCLSLPTTSIAHGIKSRFHIMPRVDFFPSLFPSCWLCLQCSTFSITSCGLCTGNYWSTDGHILIYRKMCFPKMQQYLQPHKLPQNLPVSPKVPSPWGWADFCDCLHGKISPKWHCIVSEVRVAVYLLLVSLLRHLPWKPVHHVIRKHRPHGERCQVSGVGVLALAKLLTWPRVGLNHQKREWKGLQAILGARVHSMPAYKSSAEAPDVMEQRESICALRSIQVPDLPHCFLSNFLKGRHEYVFPHLKIIEQFFIRFWIH